MKTSHGNHVQNLIGALLMLILLAAASMPLSAASSLWIPDMARSRLGFVASWEKSPIEVHFRQYEARILFDPAHPRRGRIEVSVEIASLDSGSPEGDAAMLELEWFDAAHHPWARFVATSLHRLSDGRFLARGRLTLKGVTRPVDFPFRWQRERDGARIQGQVLLRRTEFGIGTAAGGESVGPLVEVRADLHLQRVPGR